MSGLKEKVTTASIVIHTLHITAGPHTIHLEVSITRESSKTLGKSFGPYVLFRKKKTRESALLFLFLTVYLYSSPYFILVNGFFNKYFLKPYYWYIFFLFLFSDLFM